MKTFFKIVLPALLLLFLGLPGHTAAKEPFRILASTFPVYLFTLNLCEGIEGVEVDLLVPAQVGCPHNFALKPSDLAKVSRADALVINGAGLEKFIGKIIAANKNLPVIDASSGITLLEDAPEPHDHAAHHKHEGGNPHIFAAPAQAVQMVANITSGLAGLNPPNEAAYLKNLEPYTRAFVALSEQLTTIGSLAVDKKIAISHDALAYLVSNTGLDLTAIIENGESVAALARLKKQFLANRPVILAGDSQYPNRLLETLSAETGIPWTPLNTCASGPANPPLDYYQEQMKENIRILEQYFE